MKLEIDDIYSPEGQVALVTAYIKSMWKYGVFRYINWCGVPVLQLPEDLVMLAELLWTVKPDVVIECGIHKGGGLVFCASILELLGKGHVIGIDVNVDLALPVKNHTFGHRITLMKGDSGNPETLSRIDPALLERKNVLVILDSDHSAAHVKRELDLYSPLIRPGGYLVVMDGIMGMLGDVPGGSPAWTADNPEVAVKAFLIEHPEFERDVRFNRIGATFAPGGFLRRVFSSLPEGSPGAVGPRR